MEFSEFKSEIITRAKKSNACSDEYRKAYSSENFKELFIVIGRNFNWCCNNKVIDVDLLLQISEEILSENKFAVNKDISEGYLLASGSATVEASGSATVRAWGSATVEAWGSATVEASGSATVRAWGSATVRAWGSATVRAWGSATVEASGSATVEASGSATVRASGSATVEASGSATVEASGSATVEASGSATVRAWGSATVEAWGSATVRAWGSAYINSYNTIEHKISEKVILRYYYENRIVVASLVGEVLKTESLEPRDAQMSVEDQEEWTAKNTPAKEPAQDSEFEEEESKVNIFLLGTGDPEDVEDINPDSDPDDDRDEDTDNSDDDEPDEPKKGRG